MTHTIDYTKILLNIKDKNINLYENYLEKCKINGITTNIIHAFLTYNVDTCPLCKHKNCVIKWNWKRNCKVKISKVVNFNTIILLDKQRFKCNNCNHTFIAESSLVDKYCNISNDTKLSIKLDLMNKISEKDIAKNNNVSHNTVNRIIHSISNKKVLPGVLPTIMNIDEFKATNDTIGKMAFHIVNNRTGKTFDIIESRKSNFLFKYFMRFPRKQRLAVKFIILDMFEPYYLLLKKIFPNAILITDKFHVVALASNALKNTRVKCMKKDKKNYNKLKHYWKLIQKFEDDLDKDNKKYSNHFGKEITDYDIVSYIINTNKELKATYEVYQGILRSIKNKDANLFCNIVSSNHESISEYMKTTLKSLNKFSYHIIMSFNYNFNNGIIEGINNLIKCIKRIAFGYKSFYHFKTRILLISGIYKY
jgi:transposase